MDYNTRLVVFGAGLLGTACGLVGVYLLLRKRSLIGDAICHASLPGIAAGFFASVYLGGTGHDLWILLCGAAISGISGALTVLAIRHWTNLKDDAALGIVLSVYFGLGMALLSLVQQTKEGNAAGLEGFIYGNTAGIVANDARLIVVACILVTGLIVCFQKELQILCFDSAFAASQGWPTFAIDLLLLACVLVIVIIGTSIVGVLLVIAMVVVPPAAARFWSDRLFWNLVASSLFGLISGTFGALGSYVIDRVPSGAAMVLFASMIFTVSLILGAKRGLLWRALRLYGLRGRADEEHVLRNIYEQLELQQRAPLQHGEVRSAAIQIDDLVKLRKWSRWKLLRVLRRLERSGWLRADLQRHIALTAAGIQQSHRAIRRHRLLELYFARWAELSPDAIDRSADYTEHALNDELLAELERDAITDGKAIDIPPSIHPIG